MMSIPFFTASLAMILGWRGARTGAIWCTLITVLATLVLFAMHATDPLAIDL